MSEQIKLSDIRAKFPMYGDVSDENLVIALRKKYYPDIPLKQFVNRIEFDTMDPTEGMSGGEKFLAGAGKAFADLGRGVEQLGAGVADILAPRRTLSGLITGQQSRVDELRQGVAESRKRDEALMKTGAGLAGNITGNVAAMLPAAFVPGAATLPGAAAIGALSGFIQPSASTGETLTNTAVGGVIAPASILAGRGINAAWQGGKALLEPFTKKGQEAIAARTIQQFATDPKKAAENLKNARELVPGSRPTMGQAADDAGLAQLERTLQNNPETGKLLEPVYAAQRAARLKAVSDIGGTDEYYNAIKQGRQVFANEDYGRAVAQGIDPDMAKALKPQIDSLLRRPSIESSKAVAKRLAAEQDISLDNFGSVEGMDWLKKALDNQISAAKKPGSSIGDAQLRALVQTKKDLMDVLEQIAPAYKEANDNFAAMSRQVNAMDVARELQDRFQPALGRYGASTREHADAYARALEGAKESVKKSTGMDKPVSAVMPSKDVRLLEDVARDLARKAKADDLGRAKGSNTAQNLAAQNLLRRTLGPTGLPQSWAENNVLQAFLSPYTGVAKLAGAEQNIMERLARASMDPTDAASLLLFAQQPSVGLLSARAQPLLPAVSLGLLGNSR